jgi:OOP family OmpA-OmpF porin
MIRGLRAATAALALSVFAAGITPAAARMTDMSGDGFYVFGAIGANSPRDSELKSPGASQEAEFDNGLTLAGGMGYAYGNGIRAELELAVRDNDIDIINGLGASGDITSIALMGSLYYDFDTGSKFKPFIGGGLGLAHIDAGRVTPTTGASINDSYNALAGQVAAGVSYAMTDNLDLTLAYRYFIAPKVHLENSAGTTVDTEYRVHEIMFGVRFTFGGPPPAPKPMPAVETAPPAPAPMAEPKPMPKPAPPPAPRNFIVFFDWNSAVLTDAAKGIIRSAVDAAKSTGTARINLTGHADRSGTLRYNQGLSERRGAAVAAELRRLGLTSTNIAVVGKGETQPLVTTNDGVREPRNRRVEIVLE